MLSLHLKAFIQNYDAIKSLVNQVFLNHYTRIWEFIYL